MPKPSKICCGWCDKLIPPRIVLRVTIMPSKLKEFHMNLKEQFEYNRSEGYNAQILSDLVRYAVFNPKVPKDIGTEYFSENGFLTLLNMVQATYTTLQPIDDDTWRLFVPCCYIDLANLLEPLTKHVDGSMHVMYYRVQQCFINKAIEVAEANQSYLDGRNSVHSQQMLKLAKLLANRKGEVGEN